MYGVPYNLRQKTGDGVEAYKFNYGHVEFEMSVRYPGGNVEWLFGNKDLDFKKEVCIEIEI